MGTDLKFKEHLESIRAELNKLSDSENKTIFDKNVPSSGMCGKCGKACCDYSKD